MMTADQDYSDESPVDRTPAGARQTKKLSPQERYTLRHCESAVAKGLHTFYDVGDALKTIRNQRLYREKFSSFRAYCRARWGFEAARARQFIAASDVFRDVESVTDIKPVNEIQMRSLTSLDTAARQLVWKEATERSPQPTESVIKAVIHELVPAEPEAREVAVADTAALIEHMIVQANLMLRTVREWDYKAGLNAEQMSELRRLFERVRNAMRDVDTQLLH